METTEPNRPWHTGTWLCDDQAASRIQKEMDDCVRKYTTKLCMLPNKHLLLGYFYIIGVECTMVPGAHFSSLNADLMEPPRPILDPSGNRQGSPASGVQCVYVHQHPWGRWERWDCLSKMRVKCYKVIPSIRMCSSSLQLLLNMNIVLTGRRMSVVCAAAFSEVFLVCGITR